MLHMQTAESQSKFAGRSPRKTHERRRSSIHSNRARSVMRRALYVIVSVFILLPPRSLFRQETPLTCGLAGCRKGSRECIYPDANSIQKGGKGGPKTGKAGEGSSPEDHDEDAKERLAPIVDDEDESYMGSDTKGQDEMEASSTPALTLDRSPTPSVESSLKTPNVANRPPLPRKESIAKSKNPNSSKSTSHLPNDIQFYLNYFRNHMTHHHYALKLDAGDLFQNDLLKYALKYEPLLYALVGYAAYFHTLSQPDGQISTFLRYYNESVTRLRVSITKNKKQGLATFLTILQLAAIEVSTVKTDSPLPLTELLGNAR